MHEQALLSRRTIAKALPFAALVAGAIPAAAAVPMDAADSRRIDEAAARYQATKDAFASTLAELERALPPLHPSLDMTYRRKGVFQYEGERQFDGEPALRGTGRDGKPVQRMVATLDTIRLDLDRHSDCRHLRSHLYRMRRRLNERRAKVGALERSVGIWDRRRDFMQAERELSELTRKMFEQPATTMAAVLAQAKALSAFATIDQSFVKYESGRLGLILVDGLQHVARAA